MSGRIGILHLLSLDLQDYIGIFNPSERDCNLRPEHAKESYELSYLRFYPGWCKINPQKWLEDSGMGRENHFIIFSITSATPTID